MIPGVAWNPHNRRWRASLSGYGKRGYIGEYRSLDEAISARQSAELLVDGRLHDQAQVRIDGDKAYVPLWASRGRLKGWSAVDLTDLGVVGPHRWTLAPSGYAVARIGGRTLAMHILLMPGARIRDHANGDRLDNRRSNLRACTASENGGNSAPTRGRGLFKGVSPMATGGFRARLMLNRHEVWLGRYDTAEEAARAYDRGALAHFGAFARTNFPPETYAPQEGEGR